MTQISENETIEPSGKFAIAIRYGLMTGFILMFLKTISYLYLLKINFIAFGVGRFLLFAIPVLFFAIAALKQRKINGGFINIKDAFSVIFVVVLISTIISSLYGLLYAQNIDPLCLVREKAAYLEFLTHRNSPPDFIAKQVKQMDLAIASKPQFSNVTFGLAQEIIKYSIFGFIVAMFVKKEKTSINQ